MLLAHSKRNAEKNKKNSPENGMNCFTQATLQRRIYFLAGRDCKGELSVKEQYELKRILQMHTVDALKEIAKDLGIKGCSGKIKDELVKLLEQKILNPDEMKRRFLAASNDDIKKLRAAVKKPNIEIRDPRAYYYWIMNNLVYETSYGTIVVPIEVQHAFAPITESAAFIEERKRAQMIDQYALACVNLYMVVEVSVLADIINKQTKEEVTNEEIIRWCEDRRQCRGCEMYFYQDGYVMCEVYGDNILVEKDDYHLMLSSQKGKPYYIPAKKELLCYADDTYVDQNPAFEGMVFYLKNKMKLEAVDAYEFAAEIQLEIRDDADINTIIMECERMGLDFDTEAEVKGFLKYLLEMFNHTRVPSNRGYTPAEMREMMTDRDIPFVKDCRRLKEMGMLGADTRQAENAMVIPFLKKNQRNADSTYHSKPRTSLS